MSQKVKQKEAIIPRVYLCQERKRVKKLECITTQRKT